ncbi:hypothetical protein FQN55_001849 [Onygenales sp. PD_40]|nr:hypothetical protein FQN55_001849 [Onygenales sp. PD_40]KAK2800075.1 hypothetical protein FQN51_006314 [Onygenales sp. PD_10]
MAATQTRRVVTVTTEYSFQLKESDCMAGAQKPKHHRRPVKLFLKISRKIAHKYVEEDAPADVRVKEDDSTEVKTEEDRPADAKIEEAIPPPSRKQKRFEHLLELQRTEAPDYVACPRCLKLHWKKRLPPRCARLF